MSQRTKRRHHNEDMAVAGKLNLGIRARRCSVGCGVGVYLVHIVGAGIFTVVQHLRTIKGRVAGCCWRTRQRVLVANIGAIAGSLCADGRPLFLMTSSASLTILYTRKLCGCTLFPPCSNLQHVAASTHRSNNQTILEGTDGVLSSTLAVSTPPQPIGVFFR